MITVKLRNFNVWHLLCSTEIGCKLQPTVPNGMEKDFKHSHILKKYLENVNELKF